MTRLPRRASLLVAFSLLTSAATAHAECAWVLWTYDGASPSSFTTNTWRPKAPFQTYDQCRQEGRPRPWRYPARRPEERQAA